MKNKILKISIVGKTNAGKSTLLNSLVGEDVSIINKKVNTTEDLILGILNIKNHQLIFYDTPGLNNLKSINNKKKLKINLWSGINESDIILYLIDIKKYNFDEINSNIHKLFEANKDITIIFNKNDLVDKKYILPKIKELEKNLKIISFFSISAKKKFGIEILKNSLISKTYDHEWLFKNDEISNKDDIFFTNECTRNAIFTLLHKELPYNININNKMFKYLKNDEIKIKQEIEISNLRYKKIILGKNGSKIKDIRTRSQNYISKILKAKIHLYINVIKINAK